MNNPIKTRYALLRACWHFIMSKRHLGQEAEAPKVSFHLQIPYGLCPELVVFPPQAKGLTMLSFHECGHTGKGGCTFSSYLK